MKLKEPIKTNDSWNCQQNVVHVKSNDGSILSTVYSLCALGVTFSCDFTWNSHVHKVAMNVIKYVVLYVT